MWSATFPVDCTASVVAEFGKAISWPGAALSVPPTFPIVWLAQPTIRDAIAAAVAAAISSKDGLLVQLGQSFNYKRSLQVSARYSLTVALVVEGHQKQFSTQCAIRLGDEPIGEFISDFILVDKLG